MDQNNLNKIDKIKKIYLGSKERSLSIFVDIYNLPEKKDLIQELREEEYKLQDLYTASDLLGAARAYVMNRDSINKEDTFIAGGILCFLPWWPKSSIDKIYLKALKQDFIIGIYYNVEVQNSFLKIINLDVLKSSLVDMLIEKDLGKLQPKNFFTFEPLFKIEF